MNIKNRIRTIEKAMGVSGSQFCECFPQGCETWKQDLTEDGTDYREPVLMSEPLPDVCEKCEKPVQKRQIIICFGDPDHPLQPPPADATQNRQF
jgi:hypothetical protein